VRHFLVFIFIQHIQVPASLDEIRYHTVVPRTHCDCFFGLFLAYKSQVNVPFQSLDDLDPNLLSDVFQKGPFSKNTP